MTAWQDKWRELGPRGFARWFLIKRVGKVTFRKLDQVMSRSSLVGEVPVFDPADFPWVADLEAAAPKVRAELDGLLAYREHLPTLQDIQPDQEKVSSDTKWRTFVLWGYGKRSDSNCARCPETAAALSQVPGLTSAWFSILAPGKHIPRHTGVTKGVIRCHLGLKVPKTGRCEMQVGSEMVHWEEGRCVLFDDSTRHEVWNDTAEERVVLILDFERPMRWPGRLVSRFVDAAVRLSPFFRSALRNQKEWEDRVAGVLPDGAVGTQRG